MFPVCVLTCRTWAGKSRRAHSATDARSGYGPPEVAQSPYEGREQLELVTGQRPDMPLGVEEALQVVARLVALELLERCPCPCVSGYDPPREKWRLHSVRGWSDEQTR